MQLAPPSSLHAADVIAAISVTISPSSAFAEPPGLLLASPSEAAEDEKAAAMAWASEARPRFSMLPLEAWEDRGSGDDVAEAAEGGWGRVCARMSWGRCTRSAPSRDESPPG